MEKLKDKTDFAIADRGEPGTAHLGELLTGQPDPSAAKKGNAIHQPPQRVPQHRKRRCIGIAGVGEAKTMGNYAASLLAGEKAHEAGYTQVLWLDGVEQKYVEEVGSMNIFFVINNQYIPCLFFLGC